MINIKSLNKMILELKNEYKSLNKFVSHELNNFTIITGKNGSGKTQLLELIYNENKSRDFENRWNINKLFSIKPHCKFIQKEGIEIINSAIVDKKTWENVIKNELGEKLNYLHRQRDLLLNYILENNLPIENNFTDTTNFLSTDKLYLNLLIKKNQIEYDDEFIEGITPEYEKVTLKDIHFEIKNHKLIYDGLKKAMVTHKKNVKTLTIADIHNTPHEEILFVSNQFFTSKMGILMYSFAIKRSINNYLFFQKEYYKKDVVALSDEEFLKKYKKPWVLINEIFTKHNLLFYVKEIDPSQFIESEPFNFILYKRDYSDNEGISFEGLSSGEKLIIGLILNLFTFESYVEDLKFPDLLILDEPDAHLHPEMTKLLIEVLKDTFVDKLGIKVIITTHSPTTVALAPEESIYELKNGINTSLEKVNKDYALNLLTGFIPTLSIDYKNHRQVFVEAPNDRYYYQSLFDIHSQNKKLDYKLYFVSNDGGKGDCNTVRKIVKTLRGTGLSSTWGIIDRDKDNKSDGCILVHGENERYSIENYLFDPVYVVSLMIKDNIMKSRNELGLDEFYVETNLKNEKEEFLQKFSDFFFKKICGHKKLNLLNKNAEIVETEYFSGHKLNIPKWYLDIQGHDDLVPALKIQLEPLFNKYRDNNQIESELTKMICKNYPFVPKSSIELIERLATLS